MIINKAFIAKGLPGLLLLLVALLTPPCTSIAQTSGIYFEKELSWPQVLDKAKRENKYIFVDFYASWCGPCKWMIKNMFPKKDVGDYFNEHFINVAIQLDEPTDTEAAKQRRKEAKEMEQKYGVKVLPTYLFFSPDGTPVHKISIGAIKSESEFISKARDAFDKSKQYYTVVRDYTQHKMDSQYLKNALSAMLEAGDSVHTAALADVYLASIKNPFEKDAILLINRAVSSSSSMAFDLLLKNATQISEMLKKPNVIDWTISRIIAEEKIIPLFKDTSSVKDWSIVLANLKKQYPDLQENTVSFILERFEAHVNFYGVTKPIYAKGAPIPNWEVMEVSLMKQYPSMNVRKMIFKEKPKYYLARKEWSKCAQYAVRYLDEYGDKLDEYDINNVVWYYIFQHSDDRSLLERGLAWSKRSIDSAPTNVYNWDTYANLLYKLGRKAEAIEYENKAIQLIESLTPQDTTNMKILKEAKRKMMNGERTWLDDSPVPAA